MKIISGVIKMNIALAAILQEIIQRTGNN